MYTELARCFIFNTLPNVKSLLLLIKQIVMYLWHSNFFLCKLMSDGVYWWKVHIVFQWPKSAVRETKDFEFTMPVCDFSIQVFVMVSITAFYREFTHADKNVELYYACLCQVKYSFNGPLTLL